MNKPSNRPWQSRPKTAETEEKPWKKKRPAASSSAKPGARTWASKRPVAQEGESRPWAKKKATSDQTQTGRKPAWRDRKPAEKESETGERRASSDRRSGSERRVFDRRKASTDAKSGARTWSDRKPATKEGENRPWVKKKAALDPAQTGRKPAWRDRKPAEKENESRPWVKKKAALDQTQTGRKPAWRDRKPAEKENESRPWVKKKAALDQTQTNRKPAWRDKKPVAKEGDMSERRVSSDRRSGSERRVYDRRTATPYAKPGVRTQVKRTESDQTGAARLDKLHKVLANQGLGSRREIEDWIAAGRVLVNGKLAQLGDRVSGKEKIEIDGRLIKIRPTEDDAPRVLVYHKPEGEVCTRKDEEDRKTVFENLPVLRGKRWILVGRLDINTSGLLLLTTDGALANRLMHPSSEFEREYAVRILGDVDDEIRHRLLKGVMLEDGMASFKSISTAGGEGANRWYHVVVSEGRNRLVRRLWESQDLVVSRLMRVRYGNVALPKGLARGKYKELTPEQIRDITQNLGEGGKSTPFTKRK